jgi:hypothetical protein
MNMPIERRGGLISYGSSFSDASRRSPDYVDKILKRQDS